MSGTLRWIVRGLSTVPFSGNVKSAASPSLKPGARNAFSVWRAGAVAALGSAEMVVCWLRIPACEGIAGSASRPANGLHGNLSAMTISGHAIVLDAGYITLPWLCVPACEGTARRLAGHLLIWSCRRYGRSCRWMSGWARCLAMLLHTMGSGCRLLRVLGVLVVTYKR